jgi:acyl-CoA thioester hydrolase
MPRADFKFRFPKRVRYAEIDAQAVVFNSRYLEYFDIGITEYWRAVGMYKSTSVLDGLDFHVAKAVVNYKAPILVDEMIDIWVRCSHIGTSSMTFLFEIHGGDTEDLRATGEEVSVHVGEVRGRPAPVPRYVIDLFEQYESCPLKAKASL